MNTEAINIETAIKLDKFSPRSYQLSICDALENKGIKKLYIIWPRRAGKDIVCWNLMIRQALRRVGVYYYIFPTFAQGRRVLWDSITNDSIRFLDFIPPELVESKNSQLMSITLTNQSKIQIVGSDNVDALMGSNPVGAVFSEYALQDPRAYQFLRPIFLANNAWSIFETTPRGKNHAYSLYEIARHSTDWFCQKLTLHDTAHVDYAEIAKELQAGEVSEDLVQQEWFTSFELGVEGAYYTKYIDRLRLKGQIGEVPYEPSFPVHTAWDLGVRDSTAIIFYQLIGQTVRIIDYYDKNKEGLEHYARILRDKEYIYGRHYGPHDIGVTEFGSGITRIEKAKQLGIKFETITTKEGKRISAVPNVSISDGIEAVRSAFAKMWIDEAKCAQLIKSLENYRQEYDQKNKTYSLRPLHSWASHAADAMRYLVLSLPKFKDSMSEKEAEKLYLQATYGSQYNTPMPFRDDLPPY